MEPVLESREGRRNDLIGSGFGGKREIGGPDY